MYFIQCKDSHSFLVYDGLATQGDLKKGSKSLVVASSLAKSQELVTKLKEIAPNGYKFQAISKSTFQKNLKISRKEIGEKKQISGEFRKKLLVLFQTLTQSGTIKGVDSSTYCPVTVEEETEVIKPPKAQNPSKVLEKEKKECQIPPVVESQEHLKEELLYTYAQDNPQPRDTTHIIPVLPTLQEDLVQNIETTLGNLSELISLSLETTQNYQKDMKNIENQIIDELHFIEFEPTGSVDTKEVYDRLHHLRKKRRELKDKLYLSQLILGRFKTISTVSLGEDVEKVKKLEKRAYVLRAPGCHPQRGL